MKRLIRILGLVTGVFCFLGSGFYFIENGFENLLAGNIVVSLITAIFLLNSAITIFISWDYRK